MRIKDLKNIISQNLSSFSVGGGLSILPIITSSSIATIGFAYENTIQNFPIEYWIVFFICSSFTMAFALTPTTFMALFTGYFLGWNALIGMVPAYIIAAYLCYFVVKWIDQGKFSKSIEKYPIATVIIRTVHKSPLKIVAFTKLSPILPFALSNLLLAWAKTPIKEFLLGSLIGMLPRTIISIWVGKSIVDIQDLSNPNTNTYTQLIVGGLIILSIAGLTQIFTKSINKEMEALKKSHQDD
ncbi:TVP38/TMEM64 family protein [Flammeovirga kamogawensis]|uniref:TVP38/TMEM64 family membrane protein n=1 Tax=Flammeovirga kamogawensis TaxID=373891 RepID=A0ABX8GRB0_9BACT|nr:VTT domain-containing protein [Flammeovirga kamogawensis]MBB6464008.1 putative membrane protein YdjX (TVP38/TMEM64 family) [Flammeovirga kamogawensis]QWG06114.1 VTT domain-containing protein [Flammeovirga kamogawensis]TRX67946.1 VTT domain-containing protein [Flammeovirga kamogawensis]